MSGAAAADLLLRVAASVPAATAPSTGGATEPARLVDTPAPELVTPGTAGFLAIFAVAVALVFLVRDMNRRVRTVRVRADRADERLRAELDEEQRAAGPAGDGSSVAGTHDAKPAGGSDGPGVVPPRPRGPKGRDDPDDGSPVRRH